MFKYYLLEAQNYIWKQKPKEWHSVELSTLDQETKNKLWSMYESTHKGQGLDNYKHIDQLDKKYKLLWLIDVDQDKWPDAFIIYKDMPNNNKKISLLGSDGSETAKRVLKDKLYELLKTKGWYIEGSKKIDTMLTHKGFPFVDNLEDVKKIIHETKSSNIIWKGNGYYERDLTNTNIRIIKRIYGNPNV